MDREAATRFRNRILGMLEDLAQEKPLTPTPPRLCSRFRAAFGRPSERRTFELPCSTSSAFLAAVQRVTEHSGDGGFPAQKVHLKAVSLFGRARLGIDASDIWFGIRIRSSSHELCLTVRKTMGESMSRDLFIADRGFFGCW